MDFDVKKNLVEYRFKKQEAQRVYEESQRLTSLGRRLQRFEDKSGRESLIKLRETLMDKALNELKECDDTEKMINNIEDTRVRDLFCLRYIEGMKWDDIAQTLNYEIDSKAVYKIHKSELKKLEAQFGTREMPQ